MSVEIGNFVSFFNTEEEFNHLKQQDIERFIDKAAWYKVEDIGDTWLDVQAKDGTRTIHVNEAFDEYQVYTKKSLRKHLNSMLTNNNHAAVIAKIRQLYRKQEFQFKGV